MVRIRSSAAARLVSVLSLCVAGSVAAQTPESTAPKAPQVPAPTADVAKSLKPPAARDPNVKSEGGRLLDDRKFILKGIRDGLARIQFGKLAASKAIAPEVRQFGQTMADDRAIVNDQLKELATKKGLKVPTELDVSGQAELALLQKMSGAEFDREYMRETVAEARNDIRDLKLQLAATKDPDVRAFAEARLATVEKNLPLAKDTLVVALKELRASKQPASMSPSPSGKSGS